MLSKLDFKSMICPIHVIYFYNSRYNRKIVIQLMNLQDIAAYNGKKSSTCVMTELIKFKYDPAI